MQINIPTIDLSIIIFYLLGIMIIGVLTSRKQKLSSNSYFLAGRSLNWVMVGAALFASNISTIHLVGLAASGFNEGLVWGNFEWMAALILVLLGLFFAPFYFKSKISTLPEFLERRYSARSRTILAFMAIIGALFVHIGISLYAGAVVFKTFFGIDVWFSIIIISIITSIYTVIGGLKAVVITETIQTVILLIGCILLTMFAIFALPDHGIYSFEDFKAAIRPGQLNVLDTSETSSTSGLTWYGIMLGYPVLGIWYWCADQTIVQRVLGAKTERDAQIGPIFAGFIKILPMFIMVLPGVIGYVLFKDIITESNDILPVLILKLLPTGFKGLLSAALLAALMSTIAAAMNSSATLVTVDIVKKIKPSINDKSQVRIGQIAAVSVMVLAILWSPFVAKFPSIFEAINRIISNLAPPISVVFLFGIFYKRGTKEASFITLILGFILGIIVFLLDFPVYGDTRIITDVCGIQYMMQAWWLFCLCSIIFIIVSLLTPKPNDKQIELVWDSPFRTITKDKITGISDVRVLAGILILTMVILYSIFW